MAREFDVSFLGLHGSIDEETAKAIFRGEFDITAQAPDTTHYSEQDRRFFEIAKKALKNRWNEEMRRQGIKAKPSDFSEDHPPTLLRNKNAEVLAALSTEMHPEMLKNVDSALHEDEENNAGAVEPDEELFGALTEQVLSEFAEAIVSGISEALDDFAKEKGIHTEELSDEDIIAALGRWADEIIGKEIEILTTGQQAKELFYCPVRSRRNRISPAKRKTAHVPTPIASCITRGQKLQCACFLTFWKIKPPVKKQSIQPPQKNWRKQVRMLTAFIVYSPIQTGVLWNCCWTEKHSQRLPLN